MTPPQHSRRRKEKQPSHCWLRWMLLANTVLIHPSCAFVAPNNPILFRRTTATASTWLHYVNEDQPSSASASSTPSVMDTWKFDPNGHCLSPRFVRDVNATASADANDRPSCFLLRNVPGDGDCLFLAVAQSLLNTLPFSGQGMQFQALAREMRQSVVQIYQQGDVILWRDADTSTTSRQLWHQAARQENMTPDEYIKAILKPGELYGGGPELLVMSNWLRRPIAVYELLSISTDDDKNNNKDDAPQIHRVGVFGQGIFDDPLSSSSSSLSSSKTSSSFDNTWTLHILMVDQGDDKHAMVLLPVAAGNEPRSQ